MEPPAGERVEEKDGRMGKMWKDGERTRKKKRTERTRREEKRRKKIVRRNNG